MQENRFKLFSDREKEEPNVEKKKIFRLNMSAIMPYYGSPSWEETKDYSAVLIYHKDMPVASAKWEDDALVVQNVFDKKIGFRVNDQLSASRERQTSAQDDKEFLQRPEVNAQGWMLIRNTTYDSRQAVRHDPHWEKYEGWFVIPEKINGELGFLALLRTGYKPREGGNFEVLRSSEVDPSLLKMADYRAVDNYVRSNSDKLPELKEFHPPKAEEMVELRHGNDSFLGDDISEYPYLYFLNKFVVYKPRDNTGNRDL